MASYFFKILFLSLFFVSSSYAYSKNIITTGGVKITYNQHVIRIYEPRGKFLQRMIKNYEESILSVVVDSKSDFLAYFNNKNELKIYVIATGKLLKTIDLESHDIESFEFINEANAVKVFYSNKEVQVYVIDESKNRKKEQASSSKTRTDSLGSIGKEFINIDVMYGTNRKRTGSTQPNSYFGKELGKLSYGVCQVSIPIIHKAGEIERPDWFKFEYSEDPKKHIMIQSLKPLKGKDFRKYMKKSFTKMGKKDILVFIHGFSNQFDESVRRTGQLAYDLDFPGVAMTYSWPSQGSFSMDNYNQDEIFSKKSIPYLKKFLLDVIKNAPNQKVNIIAHSMGNRVLVNAIADIELSSKKEIFNQIILAAPDVNAKIFKEEILPRMQGKAKKITLYASSEDRALQASRILHDQSRLGESGEYLTIANGFDSIDATGVDPSTLGHSYFSSTQTLLYDIKNLMLKDIHPTKRELKTLNKEELTYWEMIFEKFTK